MVLITLKETCVILSIGGKQTSVLRNDCEVLEKKKSYFKEGQIITSNQLDPFALKRNMVI